ncbi:hypothetical protein SDC9_89201 [bioreactor metagenome]|uniref:Uncharacterized protein n=1 Tax=bioreactor metagenome TaxID=1076179 RepID=A0A644ZNQ4_9ZZZZ
MTTEQAGDGRSRPIKRNVIEGDSRRLAKSCSSQMPDGSYTGVADAHCLGLCSIQEFLECIVWRIRLDSDCAISAVDHHDRLELIIIQTRTGSGVWKGDQLNGDHRDDTTIGLCIGTIGHAHSTAAAGSVLNSNVFREGCFCSIDEGTCNQVGTTTG